MKHIGIVDITTGGACICAQEIVSESICIGLGDNHPEFTIHAFPFEKYRHTILAKEWEKVAKVILDSIFKLQKCGADFIIIPAYSTQYCFEEVKEKSPLPVLNIIDIAVHECVRREFKKVAILGTKITMQGGIFNQELEQSGIQPIIPNHATCDRIDDLIFNEILSYKINPKTVKLLIDEIRQLNCDSVILGCTELPLVLSEKNLGISAIDTTRLLAQKAVEFAAMV